MSVKKKYYSREIILEYLKSGEPLSVLFRGSSIIFMDEFVSEVYQLHKAGYSEEDILAKILK